MNQEVQNLNQWNIMAVINTDGKRKKKKKRRGSRQSLFSEDENFQITEPPTQNCFASKIKS